jgi:light-regulated signal transduction histidine kinase (bacteriophytochrome)
MSDEPLLTIVLRTDGTVVAADAAATALLGPTADQLLGSTLADRIGTAHRESFAKALAASPTGSAAVDLAGLRADGLPWCARLRLWSDPSSRDDNVIATGCRRFGPIRWATDTDPATVPRPGADADSVISHDIRGALRNAAGFVTVVQRTLATPSIGGLDERLTRAGGHLDIAARSLSNADDLAGGVVRLLRWAERPFTVEPLDLADVITAATTRSHAEHEGEPAEVRIDGGLPAVLADEEHLTWALAELVTNARKFHRLPGESPRPGRPIVVGVSPAAGDDERFAAIVVRDDGIGVAAALEEDAFLPGRKLQPRGDYPGVGIGLALCRQIFERHAGSCRITGGRVARCRCERDRAMPPRGRRERWGRR